MRSSFLKLLSGILSLMLLVSITGCFLSDTPKNIDIQALTDTLLAQVAFDTPLSDTGEDGSLYFPDLPAGASVKMYLGSGYFADELAVITLANASDAELALQAVDEHLEQKHDQFLNYIPEELPKIKNAVIWSSDIYVIVCITNDTATAEEILEDPADPSYTVSTEDSTEDSTLDTTEDSTTDTTEDSTTDTTEDTGEDVTPEPEPEPEPEPPDPYAIHYYPSGMIRVGNMAYETIFHIPSCTKQYAQVINRAAETLGSGIQVYDLLIPTSIGVVLPEQTKVNYSGYVDQSTIINDVYNRLSGNIRKVDAYNKLLAHKDEYLYFRTDYHWNGPAAYYAYEAFCETKGTAPYTMAERQEMRFDGFLGALYWLSCDQDPILAATPDTVYAYMPASAGVTMTCTDSEGQQFRYPVIADVTDWSASSKYLCFAAGDQPFAEFKNPSVTDGSACIVVKESFGNALMSYIVDHYSTVYEIDYRYWEGNLAQFAREHGVTDVIFANNLSMLRNNYLIGKLNDLLD